MDKNPVKNQIDLNFEKLYMNTAELKRETMKTLEVHSNFIKNYLSGEVLIEAVKDFLTSMDEYKTNLRKSKENLFIFKITI
jgi:hypothetical protein